MARSVFSWSIALASLLVVTGCDCSGETIPPTADTGPGVDGGPGGDTGPGPDTGPRPDTGPPGRCGNAMLEGIEECDDGNTTADDGCAADCTLECGDGAVTGAEVCDPGIAAGATGACPTDAAACDDGLGCTTDALDGSAVDCTASCSHADITAVADGDGCCLPGENATTDSDCPAVCGNSAVEPGETCDTSITSGPGACPASCDDGIACTMDTTTGSECTVACTNAPITAPANGDGCCPAGATPATDDDCTGCGDGTVTPPETCDTAIATGAGRCPTMASCNDGMACTTDALVGGGTCSAACTNTPITMAANGDGCCPAGATIGTDNDCAARCGDGVVTAPEQCDDGNTASGDGCSSTCRTETAMPTVYRFSDMDIRDPHLYGSVPILGCRDLTNGSILGNALINDQIQTAIRTDGDSPADGLLDLSIVQVFTPLAQAMGTSTPSYLTFDADCMGPYTDPRCTLPGTAMRTMGTAMNMGGGAVCLGPVAGTTRASYTPALISPTAPAGGTCYVVNAGSVTINLAGISLTLQDAAIGGEWFGTPATEIRDGMIRGFLSEAAANAAIIPAGTTGIASIDGQPVSRLLRGGAMNCQEAAPAMGDLDIGPGGARGWYFYINFTAVDVPMATGF